MDKIILIATIYTAIGIGLFIWCKNRDDRHFEGRKLFALLFVVSLAIRVYYSLGDLCFEYDMNCFKAWSVLSVQRGLKNMYSGDFFLDYPPGYIYVLWLSSIVREILKIDWRSKEFTFIIKMGPVVCDMLAGVLVYKIADKKIGNKWAVLLSALWLFNPAMIYNSAVWGQVDVSYILFMLLALYCAEEDHTALAAVFYAVSLVTKPQALLFGPVFLFYIIKKRDVKSFFVAVGVGLLTMWALVLPFSQGISPLWLVKLYAGTLGEYKLFSFNGYNLYALLGLNCVGLGKYAGSGAINILVIGAVMAVIAMANVKEREAGRDFTTALLLITTIFTFGTMMHERYILPTIAMAMFSFIYTKKEQFIYLFFALTTISYLNIAHVMISQNTGSDPNNITVRIIGGMCTAVALVVIRLYCVQNLKGVFDTQKKVSKIALLICVVAFLQFWALGSFNAPQTFYQAENEGDWFVINFGQEQNINEIHTFLGMGDEFSGVRNAKIQCDFTLLIPGEDGLWIEACDLNHRYVFTWESKDVQLLADRVMVRANSEGRTLNEIVLTDSDGQIIRGSVEQKSQGGKYQPEFALDESHFIPKDFREYYYSSYFDEIYFARTGYEIAKGYTVYETTHPPVGKILIAIGIKIFGMTPFGWRFMGAVAGIVSVWRLYLLAMQIAKNEKTAFFVAVLYSFDFMRYTQTRIATVDSFLGLFVILMFLFMARYDNCGEKGSWEEFFNLFLSGVFMGCAVGTKWNGAYSALGLAVYFFFILYKKCSGFDTAHRRGEYFFRTMAKCVITFVLIPACLYFASFYPVIRNMGTSPIKRFIDSQVNMYNYHSKLVAEHFFSSPWYSWLVIYKPVWYAVSRSGGKVSTISALGNPVIWLLMPVAVLVCAVLFIKNKESAEFLPVAGYLFSLLPWMFITRLTFIYHYYPCTLFGILALGICFDKFTRGFEDKKRVRVAAAFAVVAVIAFGVFFPVISGMPAGSEYVDGLEILSTWYFN